MCDYVSLFWLLVKISLCTEQIEHPKPLVNPETRFPLTAPSPQVQALEASGGIKPVDASLQCLSLETGVCEMDSLG